MRKHLESHQSIESPASKRKQNALRGETLLSIREKRVTLNTGIYPNIQTKRSSAFSLSFPPLEAVFRSDHGLEAGGACAASSMLTHLPCMRPGFDPQHHIIQNGGRRIRQGQLGIHYSPSHNNKTKHHCLDSAFQVPKSQSFSLKRNRPLYMLKQQKQVQKGHQSGKVC